MNWKETYTKVFLKQLNKTVNSATVAEYMPIWWQNTREKTSGGLRLTELGFDVINTIDLATYEIPYPADMPITTQIIIFLDKFIDCPYYISKHSMFVTSERKAVELGLFSGDLRKYGLAKAMSRQTKDE